MGEQQIGNNTSHEGFSKLMDATEYATATGERIYNHELAPGDILNADSPMFGGRTFITRETVNQNYLPGQIKSESSSVDYGQSIEPGVDLGVNKVQSINILTDTDGKDFGIAGVVGGTELSSRNLKTGITKVNDTDVGESAYVTIGHLHSDGSQTENPLTGERAERAKEIIAGRAARHIGQGLVKRVVSITEKQKF